MNNAYHSQRDNVILPSSTCNTTACVNALAAINIQPAWHIDGQQDEDILTRYLTTEDAKRYLESVRPDLKGLQPRLFSECLEWAVNILQGATICKRKLITYKEMIDLIKQDDCVIAIGGLFTGSGGHYVCAVNIIDIPGGTSKIVCIDSWGDWSTGYKDKDGYMVKYNPEEFRRLTWGKYNTHPALIFKSI